MTSKGRSHCPLALGNGEPEASLLIVYAFPTRDLVRFSTPGLGSSPHCSLLGQHPTKKIREGQGLCSTQPSVLAYNRCLIEFVANPHGSTLCPSAGTYTAVGQHVRQTRQRGAAAWRSCSREAASPPASAGLAEAQEVGRGQDSHTPSCFRAWHLGPINAPNTCRTRRGLAAAQCHPVLSTSLPHAGVG